MFRLVILVQICTAKYIIHLFLSSLYFNTLFNSSVGPKYGNISFDDDDVANCFIQLNIYYKTLGYSESYESPLVDVVTLFSNLGGVISLLCGVSLLSIFEIIDVFIETVLIIRKYKKIAPSPQNNEKI